MIVDVELHVHLPNVAVDGRGTQAPTVSEHMRILVDAGLVSAKRVKQWTFYKRDEKAINALKRALREML